MGRNKQYLVAAAALATTAMVSGTAGAAPEPKGTFVVSAERLVASNLHIAGGVSWIHQVAGAPGATTPFDSPRLAFDYFIIDGLSLGGHVGFGFYAIDGADSAAWIALLPRVGYAFSLSNTFDFWPRAGVGLIAGDAAGNDTGVLSLEAMFLANLTKNFAIEFGPAADLPFAAFWPDAVIGANAGIAIKF